MKIKRFFASDIRQAIKLVREELGPEAVILSNRQVKGGVEIVSAVDYDENLLQEFAGEALGSAASTAPQSRASSARAAAPGDQASSLKEATSQRPRPQAPRPQVAAKPAAAASQEPDPNKQVLVWSQEPTLVEMRREIETLRGLLENQLSGLAWSELQRRFPLKAQLLQRLSKLGLSAELSQRIADTLRSSRDMDTLWRDALSVLSSKVPIQGDDIMNSGGVIAFVGPTGVGKTTTIAKLAARFALRHGPRHVGLITLDNYRVGAHEQLRAYGRILDVPVRTASSADELNRFLGDMEDRRLVLIDTAGVSHRDQRMADQLGMLRRPDGKIHNYLVLASTTRLSALEDIANAYQQAPIHGCILTKLDETTSLGSSLSAVIQFGLPVAFYSDGQRVPEDLHPARAETLVERAVTIMKSNDAFLEDELLTYKSEGVLTDARI